MNGKQVLITEDRNKNFPEMTDLLRYWPMLEMPWRKSMRVRIPYMYYVIVSFILHFAIYFPD
jgi:hypothetical protein